MSVEEIEQAAKALPTNELDGLVTRLHDFFNERWDKQMEEDAKAGRLDKLVNEAKEEYRQGLTLPFDEGKRQYSQANARSK